MGKITEWSNRINQINKLLLTLFLVVFWILYNDNDKQEMTKITMSKLFLYLIILLCSFLLILDLVYYEDNKKDDGGEQQYLLYCCLFDYFLTSFYDGWDLTLQLIPPLLIWQWWQQQSMSVFLSLLILIGNYTVR